MINRLEFSIDIKADKSKIWKALWNDNFYRDWAGEFGEGSFVLTDNWKEGSTVQFLSPDQSGIYSTIEKHIPNEIMSFRHVGLVANGKELPIDKETKAWSGATESYSLTESQDCIRLNVDIDVLDEHLEFMKDRFPKALEKVKSNSCE